MNEEIDCTDVEVALESPTPGQVLPHLRLASRRTSASVLRPGEGARARPRTMDPGSNGRARGRRDRIQSRDHRRAARVPSPAWMRKARLRVSSDTTRCALTATTTTSASRRSTCGPCKTAPSTTQRTGHRLLPHHHGRPVVPTKSAACTTRSIKPIPGLYAVGQHPGRPLRCEVSRSSSPVHQPFHGYVLRLRSRQELRERHLSDSVRDKGASAAQPPICARQVPSLKSAECNYPDRNRTSEWRECPRSCTRRLNMRRARRQTSCWRARRLPWWATGDAGRPCVPTPRRTSRAGAAGGRSDPSPRPRCA